MVLFCLFIFLLPLPSDTMARELPEVADSNNTVARLHKLTFKRRPPPLVYAQLGKRLKLICRVRGHGGLSVTWYKRTPAWDKLRTSSRVQAMPNSLLFHTFQEGDAGNYSCLAEAKEGHRARAEFSVLAEQPGSQEKPDEVAEGEDKAPTWARKYREDLYYPAGTLVRLRCHSKGRPPPHIIWMKDGKKRSEGSTLVIRKLLSRHEGEYVCIAENRLGKITHKYNLNVIAVNKMVPPMIEGVQNQTVSEGGVARFKCSVNNDKAPFIEWSRSTWPNTTEEEQAAETETTDEDSTKIFVQKKQTQDKDVLYLIIQNVTVDDTGLYSCKAVNTYGKTRKSAWLSLKSEADISAMNDNLVDGRTNPISVSSGSNGILWTNRLLQKYKYLQLNLLMLFLMFYH